MTTDNAVKLAAKAAKNGEHRVYKVGAVLMNKNKMVSTGFNKLKTHPGLHAKYGYFAIHAENDAVMKGDGDTIIIVRLENKTRRLTCAKPCPRCMKFLRDSGISRIIYSDWDSSIKEIFIQ